MKLKVLQYVGHLPRKAETVEDDQKFFYIIPDTTEWDYRFGKRERPNLSAPQNYPGVVATAIWNKSKREEERAERTRDLFRKITVRDLRTTSTSYAMKRSSTLLSELKALRPQYNDLLVAYLSKGVSLREAALILTHYEQLPAVKISEEQFHFLEQALRGTIDEAVIQKDFHV